MNDKETVMAMHIAQKNLEAQGRGDDRPVGPRISQVSEEARRLGEVVATLQWLGRVILHASPKFKTQGKIGKIDPYPKPVMIDPETGEWSGKPSSGKLRRNHEHRLKIAAEAAKRWAAADAGGQQEE